MSVLAGVGANVMDHPWCLLNVDVREAAMIEARPVSGALLRYELDDPELDGTGDGHVEAEIFPWQLRPYDLTSPPVTVAFTAALMAPRSRGSFTLTPAGRELRVGLLADDTDAAHMVTIVRQTAAMIDGLAEEGVNTRPRCPTAPGGRPKTTRVCWRPVVGSLVPTTTTAVPAGWAIPATPVPSSRPI